MTIKDVFDIIPLRQKIRIVDKSDGMNLLWQGPREKEITKKPYMNREVYCMYSDCGNKINIILR